MITKIYSTVTERTVTIEGFGNEVAIEINASGGERLLINVPRDALLAAVEMT